MNNKDKQPKKQEHPRDKKSTRELEILYACVQEYKNDPNKSQNKRKICQKYCDILISENFTTYTPKIVSDFVNNFRNKDIPPQYNTNLHPLVLHSTPMAAVPPPPFQQIPQNPISSQINHPQQINIQLQNPQQLTSQQQTPQQNEPQHIDQKLLPFSVSQNNYQPQTPINYSVITPPQQQVVVDPNPTQASQQSTDQNLSSQNLQPFTEQNLTSQPPSSSISRFNSDILDCQTPSDIGSPALFSGFPSSFPSRTSSMNAGYFSSGSNSTDLVIIQDQNTSSFASSAQVPFPPPPPASPTTLGAITPQIIIRPNNDSTKIESNRPNNDSTKIESNRPNNDSTKIESNRPNIDSIKIESNRPDINSNLNDPKNDENIEDEDADVEDDEEDTTTPSSRSSSYSGKRVGIKGAHFILHDDSSSSRSSSVPPATGATNQCDALIATLPTVPEPPKGELDEVSLDSFKNEIYGCIGHIYHTIHSSRGRFFGEDADEERLRFQEECEERLMGCVRLLAPIIKSQQLFSHDSCCKTIQHPKISRLISITTKLINGVPVRFDTSSSSDHESTVTFKHSSDKVFDKFKESSSTRTTTTTTTTHDTKSYNNNTNSTNSNNIKYVSKIDDGGDVGGGGDDSVFEVNRLSSSSVAVMNENPVIGKLYNGEYDEKSHFSVDVDEAEAAAVISYARESSSGDDVLVCECARAVFNGSSHVLRVKDAEVNTGFFLPVTSLHFHREDDTNKLFVSGDQRVKEFTIDGLETAAQPTLTNTNTFFFGRQTYKACALVVWDGELVFGCGDKIFFWNVKNRENYAPNRETLDDKVEAYEIQSSGLDLEKVDWTRGKSYRTSSVIRTKGTLEEISALEIVRPNKDSKSGESYLAVCSYSYPVIYIYNKCKQIVSRLVSHTMGVTSLRAFNSQLISGSLDLIARIWNINEGVPDILCDTKNQRITAIEKGIIGDSLLLFTGGEDASIIAFGISKNTPLFEIKLNRKVVIREIRFVAGNVGGNNKLAAKLMVVSEYVDEVNKLNNRKKFNVQFFEFK